MGLIYVIVIFIFRLSWLCSIKRVFVSRSEMSRNFVRDPLFPHEKGGLTGDKGID